MIVGVFSVSPKGGMGKDNKLLYYDTDDMRLFQQNTKGNVVIMGRATWDSLPKKPLMNRTNIVVTKEKPLDFLKYKDTMFVTVKECDTIIRLGKTIYKTTDVYIIGGARLLNRYKNDLQYLYVSHFKEEKEADTYLPQLDMSEFSKTYEEDYDKFVYCEYEKISELDKKVIEILK